jgi:hypothetical protein
MTERFNNVCDWVTFEILNTEDIELRAKKMIFFYEIAKNLYKLGNFQSNFFKN